MASITEETRGFSVYVFTFPNAKRYVGKMATNGRRWDNHILHARNGRQHVLYNAIRKYGWENISKEVFSGFTEAGAFKEEKRLIRVLESRIEYGKGYNLTDGGEGPSGYKHSPEALAKMSAAQVGKSLSPEHRAKIGDSNRGKKHSQESIEKMSAAKKGKKMSAKTRAKMSAAHKGKVPWNKGKTLSAEHCAKMSNAQKGKPKPTGFGAKISAASKGKPKSPESVAKSAATRGKFRDENIDEVVQMLAEGKSMCDVGNHFGVSASTIHRWENIAKSGQS